MAKTNIVDWKTITNFVIDSFVGYGIPKEDAEICADVLLMSDKRGIESHGVNRFKPVYLDRIKAGIQQPVLLYLAVFHVLPFSLIGILEINKKVRTHF